ncbi:MAG: AraC family transcriptional regulator [Phycisphaeraceae bacterium]
MGKNVARTIIEHYQGDRLVLPELAVFGWDRHPRTSVRLRPHAHQSAWEVCYLVRGSVEWWCGPADSPPDSPEVFQVGRGDVYLTRPGEEHGGVDSMMHPCELYFFQLRFPPRRALPGLTAGQTATIADGFAAIRRRCFVGSPSLLTHFRTIHEAHRHPGAGAGELAAIAARAALHEILVRVLADHDQAVAGRDDDHPQRIAGALRWMDAHDHEEYRVADVAAAVGLGVSRFHELFVQETGFTPKDYRARRKIARARQLLRTTDRDVTDLAFALGFSSSQYFATVFKKLSGMTPGEYRRRVRG